MHTHLVLQINKNDVYTFLPPNILACKILFSCNRWVCGDFFFKFLTWFQLLQYPYLCFAFLAIILLISKINAYHFVSIFSLVFLSSSRLIPRQFASFPQRLGFFWTCKSVHKRVNHKLFLYFVLGVSHFCCQLSVLEYNSWQTFSSVILDIIGNIKKRMS